MFCNKIRRIVGTLVAILFAALLASCGGGDSSGVDVYPPAKLTRHQIFSQNSVANSPMLRSNVVLTGSGVASQTQKNGRVVEVFPVWTKDARGEYHEAVYVLYSFVDDSVIKTGSLSTTAAVNTELWRYSPTENAWCPLISGTLGFSTSSAQMLRPPGRVSFERATPIRLLVGTADGVVGQIAFVDPNPTSGDCTPVTTAPGMSSLYTVMYETGMRGGISNMKLVEITPPASPTVPVNPLANVRGLYIWGGSVCSASGINASGDCTAWTSQIPMAGLLDVSTGQWLNAPATNMAPLVGDPGSPRANPNSAGSEAQSLDVRMLASADYKSVSSKVIISYVQGPQQIVLYSSTAPVYNSAGPWFDTRVIANGASDAPTQSSGGAVNWMPWTTFDSRGSVFLFTPNRYDQYTGGQECSVRDFTQVPTCQRVRPPSQYPFPTNGSPTFGAAVPFEVAAVDWSAFALDPKQLTANSLMSINPLLAPPAQNVMFWMDSALANFGTSADWPLVSPNFLTTINGQPQLLLSDARALVVPSMDGKSLRAFLMAATTDISPPPQPTTTITNGQLLNGGIMLCVVTAQPGVVPVDFSACGKPRPMVPGEAADGYVYGDATVVAGQSDYMTAPSLIRFSVAPDASVVKVYSVTKAGRISVVAANKGAAQWNSWSNGWTNISMGRSSTCTTALNKPILPDPPPQSQQPTPPKHWWQKTIAHAFSKSFVAGTLAMAADLGGEALGGPAGGLAAGFIVDLAIGASMDIADEKGKKESAAAPPADAQQVYDQWVALFDQVSLTQSCTLN